MDGASKAQAWLENNDNKRRLARYYAISLIGNRAMNIERPAMIGPDHVFDDGNRERNAEAVEIMQGLVGWGYLRKPETPIHSEIFGGDLYVVSAKAYDETPMVPAALNLFEVWKVVNNIDESEAYMMTRSIADSEAIADVLPASWFFEGGREGYLKRLLTLDDVEFRLCYGNILLRSNRLTEAINKFFDRNDAIIEKVATLIASKDTVLFRRAAIAAGMEKHLANMPIRSVLLWARSIPGRKYFEFLTKEATRMVLEQLATEEADVEKEKKEG